MGMPLLEDVVQSMEQAIKAKEGSFAFLILRFLLVTSFNEASNIYIWISSLR
jgi:hypothetical protein